MRGMASFQRSMKRWRCCSTSSGTSGTGLLGQRAAAWRGPAAWRPGACLRVRGGQQRREGVFGQRRHGFTQSCELVLALAHRRSASATLSGAAPGSHARRSLAGC